MIKWKKKATQLGFQNFIPPLILNTNFIKQESKTGYQWNSIWDRLDCESAVVTTTLCSTTNGGSFLRFAPIEISYSHI